MPHLGKEQQSTVLGAAISAITYSDMSQLSVASSKFSKASARLGLSSPSATSAAASNTMALANGFHDVDLKADDRDEKETVTDNVSDATTVPGVLAVRSMTNTKPRSSGRKKLGMVVLLALLAFMGLFGVSMYQRSREAAQESSESVSMYDCEEGEEGINRRVLYIAKKGSNIGVDPEISSKIIRRRAIKDMMTTLDGNYDIAVNKGGSVRVTGGKQQLRRNLQMSRKGCEKVTTSRSPKRTSTMATPGSGSISLSMSMSTSTSMPMSTSMCMSISDKKKGSKVKSSFKKKKKSNKKSTKKIKSKEPSAKKMHSVSMSMCMSISSKGKGSAAKSASSAKKMPDKNTKEQL